MVDVTRGRLRIRAWPKKRGKAKTKAEQALRDDFAEAQWASKYLAPQIIQFMMRAREGTPILPRDLTTMMFFNRMMLIILPDGRKVYPMPAYLDVSEALDVITQELDMTLVRGVNGWEYRPYNAGGGQWQMLADVQPAVTGAVPYVEVADIDLYTEIMAFTDTVTTTSGSKLVCAPSVDGGATFLLGDTNFDWVQPAGSRGSSGTPYFNLNNGLANSSGVVQITNNFPGTRKWFYSPTQGQSWCILTTTDDVITNIRIQREVAANLTGGRITVLGR